VALTGKRKSIVILFYCPGS